MCGSRTRRAEITGSKGKSHSNRNSARAMIIVTIPRQQSCTQESIQEVRERQPGSPRGKEHYARTA
jgi:hypothetical protein